MSRAVASQPKEFFAGMPLSGSVKGPLIFAILCFLIGAILSAPLAVLDVEGVRRASGNLGSLLGGLLVDLEGQPPLLIVAVAILALILAPLVILARIYVYSGIVHLLLRIFRRDPKPVDFEVTLRVFCYASVAASLSWLPFVGVLASAYGLYLLFAGIDIAYERAAT